MMKIGTPAPPVCLGRGKLLIIANGVYRPSQRMSLLRKAVVLDRRFLIGRNWKR